MAKHTRLGVEREFFKNLRAGSRIKQKIVVEYFVAYNRIMTKVPGEKVGYADLFAGPGLYTTDQGETHKSIPVLVCEQVLKEEAFRRKVHLWFNEGDAQNFDRLKVAVNSISGVESLKYPPTIDNKIVDASWASRLRKLRVPTLAFLDPCGYKGLSLGLVASALAGHGNDCIFFFNYSRINMKLDLDIMNRSIDEFFEPERAAALRTAIPNQGADEREETILAAVKSAISQTGATPVIFKFISDQGRTSHHLVLASKHAKAVAIMKRIVNSAGSAISEGVGSGEHDPRSSSLSGSLFAGLCEVEDRLLTIFAGRKIRFSNLLYEEETHTRFTESNYRDALLKLEVEGTVVVDPPSESRRFQAGGAKRTLPKTAWLRFRGSEDHGN